MGKDHTLFSKKEGYVAFDWDPVRKRQVVSIEDQRRVLPPKKSKRQLREEKEWLRIAQENPALGLHYYGEEFKSFLDTLQNQTSQQTSH